MIEGLTGPDDLAEKYAKPVESDTFEVFFSGGEAVTCKRIKRYGDIGEFKRGLLQFWEFASGNPPTPQWQNILPLTWDEAVAVYTLHFYSTGESQFSQLAASRMVHNWAELSSLVRQISAGHDRSVGEHAAAEVEDAKKESSQTSGIESA